MKHVNLTTSSNRRAMFALSVRCCGAVLASALLVVVSQAAPPAQQPAAPGRDASPPATVKQTSHETPALGVPSSLKPNGAKSPNVGKTPIRSGAQPSGDANGSSGVASAGSSFIAVMSSLAVVIGLLFLILWVMRRAMPGGARKLPADVLDVLGYMPLGNRQQAQLLRLGNKLLLVNVTATGAETLSEVTDADEVERLTNLSRQPAAASPAASFRQILHQFERKPAAVASTAKRRAPSAPGSSTGQERARG